ncbi:MAG: right-handed parallel beta-helix repeat-containing protein [Oscillibacter sp.]
MQLGELSAGGMPSHDVSGSSDSGQTPPDKPDGETQSGSSFTAGEESVTLDFANAEITKNDESIELGDLAEGDILTVEVGSNNTAASATVESVGGGQSFGGSGEVTQGTAATTISEDGTYSGGSYTSTGDDENALRVDGAAVTLDGVTVDKSAGVTSNTEDGEFYGMNAALLAMNGATVTIKNATVTSSAQNGNGVFSYGSGTTVNISDSTITTTADNSGGIQTTGGGTVNVSGGAYTSNGYNSPTVYSTADITVKNANLTANNSEALVIEGKNSITLEDCYVTGNMSDTKGTSSSENVHNVMIYQSMSGDADVGNIRVLDDRRQPRWQQRRHVLHHKHPLPADALRREYRQQ